jgi:hypothetical protein
MQEFNKPSSWKDWLLLLTAWGAGLGIFIKAAFGFDIDPFVAPGATFVLITIFIAWNLYGVYKNTFVTPKGKKQKKFLEDNHLK